MQVEDWEVDLTDAAEDFREGHSGSAAKRILRCVRRPLGDMAVSVSLEEETIWLDVPWPTDEEFF